MNFFMKIHVLCGKIWITFIFRIIIDYSIISYFFLIKN